MQRVSSLYEEHGITDKDPLFLKQRTQHKDLDNANIKYATGPWTNRELHILLQNIRELKEIYNIDNFGDFYRSGDISKCQHLHSKTDMLIFLGRGILRLLSTIRWKLNVLYRQGDANDAKHYTAKEIEKLISLQKKYGCDWEYISKILRREPRYLRQKFNMLVKDYNIRHKIDDLTKVPYELTYVMSGSSRIKFTKEEDDKLREGVHRFKTKNDQTDWNKVWQYVGTRTKKVLRERWELYLKLDRDLGTRKKETFKNPRNRFLIVVRCLRVFISSKITDLNHVNWQSVTGFIKVKNLIEGEETKQVFFNYVNKNVSDWRIMKNEEILHYLLHHKNHLAARAERRANKFQMEDFHKI